LSPPLIGKGDQTIAFNSLVRLIATDKVNSEDYYPLYIIELERFLKVIKYANLSLSKEDIVLIA